MEKKTIELIRDLSNAFGVSGFEDEVVKIAMGLRSNKGE